MKILLIGNGFDKEHGLPTSYGDFLDFCRLVLLIYDKNTSESIFNSSLANCNEKIKESLCALFKKRDDSGDIVTEGWCDELHSCIKGNIWYHYFEKVHSSLGGNWVDFETEIAHVIRELDSVWHAHITDRHDSTITSGHSCLGYIKHYSKSKQLSDSPWYNSFISELVEELNSDLDMLIRALELYLQNIVNRIDITHECPRISMLSPDMVLSFNYTNTFERVYGKDQHQKYCYIHGKAREDSTLESCNLVLGIDEYLEKDQKDTELQFLSFKKYFQRIYKGTDSTYYDWLEKSRNECTFGDVSELYIFGHSLDVTDKDVLRLLISSPYIKTTVFYYHDPEKPNDRRDLDQKIRNLIRIIGQDELIKRTGQDKTIRFIAQ